MRVTRVSPLSHKVNQMYLVVTGEQIERWVAGELVQDVMPNLTPEEREFIMTGITPEEWDESFLVDGGWDEEV